uniref:Uncharacterized protein n=1 Tax=Amphimedon queenslandica TaxID=400682 RepID=A0A1X7SSF9_AMPQE
MIYRDLSDELAQFDLRKEQELRQVFLDLAAGQMEKNEKLQGKRYAMKCLLDTPIKPSLGAIQFVSNNNTTTTTTTTTTTGGGGGGDNK